MTQAGVRAGSVVKKYSARWVPVRSSTNTQRIGASPHPDLYQCPTRVAVATRRVPPPSQPPVSRVREHGARLATACRGLGRAAPLTRGRPLPAYRGGGWNRLASGGGLLTSVPPRRWRGQKAAHSWVP